MQDLVGIVRAKRDDAALEGLGQDRAGAARSGSSGNREYNPGWHTALDLRQPAHRLGGHHAAALIEARRAGAGTSATTIPTRTRVRRQVNHVVAQADGDAAAHPTASGDAGRAQGAVRKAKEKG